MNATLYRIKPRFQRTLEPVVDGLHRRGTRADIVTWFGFGLSAGCGALALAGTQSRLFLLGVPLLLLFRMAANAIDGQLARRSGPTARGAVLNEVLDVAGDAVAYLPFAILLGSRAAWLVVAVVVSGLVAEVAAVVGPAVRRNDGPLGKSDRALGFSLVAVGAGAGLDGSWIWVGLAAMFATALVTIRNRMRAV